jgi:hypothetical protein
MRTDARAPTLEAAKDQFEAAWRQWLAWAELREQQMPPEATTEQQLAGRGGVTARRLQPSPTQPREGGRSVAIRAASL